MYLEETWDVVQDDCGGASREKTARDSRSQDAQELVRPPEILFVSGNELILSRTRNNNLSLTYFKNTSKSAREYPSGNKTGNCYKYSSIPQDSLSVCSKKLSNDSTAAHY